MRSDIVPGSLFPDYELSDHTAKRRKLSELQGPHPMVLRPADDGRAPSGPACGHEKVPARLGHHDAGNAGRVEGRPQRALLPLWQDVCSNAGRAGLVWPPLARVTGRRPVTGDNALTHDHTGGSR